MRSLSLPLIPVQRRDPSRQSVLDATPCNAGRQTSQETLSRRWSHAWYFLTCALLATLMGCAPVRVKQTTLQQTYTDVRADIVTAGEISQMTRQVLRMHALDDTGSDPVQVIQALEKRNTWDPDTDLQMAVAELALEHAIQQETANPSTAADWYLLAAARS